MQTEKIGFQMGVSSMGDALDGTRPPVQETREREQQDRAAGETVVDTETATDSGEGR